MQQEPAMNLSTQLNRGALALPMLAMFVLLGFVAGEPVQAETKAHVALVAQQQLLEGLCKIDGGKSRILVLSQAPADLGQLVVRWKAPCRA